MVEEHIVTHVYPPPDDQVRLKLTKNSRGYGWEISVCGESVDEALASLRVLDEQMRTEYGEDKKKPVGAVTPNGLDNATSL